MKAASDIVRLGLLVPQTSLAKVFIQYAPVSGTIETINEVLADQPGLLNKSAEDKGTLAQHVWISSCILVIMAFRLALQNQTVRLLAGTCGLTCHLHETEQRPDGCLVDGGGLQVDHSVIEDIGSNGCSSAPRFRVVAS